jgi:tetratricopeptide (TPR) repeat protein
LKPKPEYTVGLFKEIQLASKKETPPPYMAENQAIAALFLQAGFNEAALKLLDGNFLQNIFPEEITVAYTEALLKNRNPSVALQFLATKEELPVTLQLKKAEALFEEGNSALATSLFYEVALSETPSGEKATMILAKQLIEDKQWKKAQKLVNSHWLARASIKGKELLARAAVFQNNPSQARILYQSIEEESVEAQSYLARAAFEQEDFEKAKELTIKLLESYPDSETLKNNLDKLQGGLHLF